MAAVEDAILVAGGIGSRMLPASAAIAKEALPLVDVPALAHLAREAISAGATRLHIITSPSKDLSSLLRDNSALATTRPDLDPNLVSPFSDVEVHIHTQTIPRGFGDEGQPRNSEECDGQDGQHNDQGVNRQNQIRSHALTGRDDQTAKHVAAS